MYFKTLPKLIYSYKDKDKNQIFTTVPDIFRRVQLDKFFANRNKKKNQKKSGFKKYRR